MPTSYYPGGKARTPESRKPLGVPGRFLLGRGKGELLPQDGRAAYRAAVPVEVGVESLALLPVSEAGVVGAATGHVASAESERGLLLPWRAARQWRRQALTSPATGYPAPRNPSRGSLDPAPDRKDPMTDFPRPP
jgi:hypothetical protein